MFGTLAQDRVSEIGDRRLYWKQRWAIQDGLAGNGGGCAGLCLSMQAHNSGEARAAGLDVSPVSTLLRFRGTVGTCSLAGRIWRVLARAVGSDTSKDTTQCTSVGSEPTSSPSCSEAVVSRTRLNSWGLLGAAGTTSVADSGDGSWPAFMLSPSCSLGSGRGILRSHSAPPGRQIFPPPPPWQESWEFTGFVLRKEANQSVEEVLGLGAPASEFRMEPGAGLRSSPVEVGVLGLCSCSAGSPPYSPRYITPPSGSHFPMCELNCKCPSRALG
jgi:hypothetical protein